MSYQTERDDFLSILGSEGIRPDVARTLLREATTLQRLAALSCSSERADRDRVRCPKAARFEGTCLCRDYGSFDADAPNPHGDVPRIAFKEWSATKRVGRLCVMHKLTPYFGGDPRGCMLVVGVPSGRTNDWEGRGIAVPSQGYKGAQMDRICR